MSTQVKLRILKLFSALWFHIQVEFDTPKNKLRWSDVILMKLHAAVHGFGSLGFSTSPSSIEKRKTWLLSGNHKKKTLDGARPKFMIFFWCSFTLVLVEFWIWLEEKWTLSRVKKCFWHSNNSGDETWQVTFPLSLCLLLHPAIFTHSRADARQLIESPKLSLNNEMLGGSFWRDDNF